MCVTSSELEEIVFPGRLTHKSLIHNTKLLGTGIHYFIVFHFIALQRLHLLQIGLWQPCLQKVYRCHFSNSICSPCVSVSYFGTSPYILRFSLLLYLLGLSVITDI